MNLDDPKLTAYALGELDDAERAAVAAQLEQSPEARRAVADIRAMAGALTNELAAEPVAALTPAQRAKIHQQLPDAKIVPWSAWRRLAATSLTALAASVAVVLAWHFTKLKPEPQPMRLAKTTVVTGGNPQPKQPAVPAPVAGGVLTSTNGVFAWPADGRVVVGGTFTTVNGENKSGIARLNPDGSLDTSFGLAFSSAAYSVIENGGSSTINVRRTNGSTGPVSIQFGTTDGAALMDGYVQQQSSSALSGWYYARAINGPVVVYSYDSGAQVEPGLVLRTPPFNIESATTATYPRLIENPFVSVLAEPLSTFSIDVDTASYANVRRFLNANQLPPRDAVRIEELVNYFSYRYPAPRGDDPFSAGIEAAGCPWNAQHRLVRVALKGRELAPAKRPASNFVFLIDVSGSMQPAERLPLIKQGLRMLVKKMNAADRVAIVVYASEAGIKLASTSCEQKERILAVLDALEAGGSTNGGEGIQQAYRVAQEHFIPGGVNRVILCTDGDFNVGITDQRQLVQLIQEKAKGGIFLTTLGVGTDNYKDALMQQLADKGNGNYHYLDTVEEAQKVLIEQMNGTLVTIAKDVKIQIEFNPAVVGAYRLIGYEKRVMPKQDFHNDAKDAGEIGAGHTVTAFFEIIPAGVAEQTRVDELKYQSGKGTGTTGSSVKRADPQTREELEAARAQVNKTIADNENVFLPNHPKMLGLRRQLDDIEKRLQVPQQLEAKREELQKLQSEVLALGRQLELAQKELQKAQQVASAKPERYVKPDASREMLTLKLRYKQPDGDKSKLLEFPFTDSGASYGRASGDFKFAAAVAGFGMILRESEHRGTASLDAVLELAEEGKGDDKEGYRSEFINLVKKARALKR